MIYSFWTFYSLVMQMARMVPDPSERYRGGSHVPSDPAGGRCGCCPFCHEFVYIETGDSDAEVLCPRCGQGISQLDPLAADHAK